MNMRLVLRFLLVGMFFGIYQFCYAQNVLKLYSKRNYYERNLFSYDSTLRIFCAVCYDEPNVIDEQFCYQLDLSIRGLSKRFLPVTFELTDSINVQSNFDLYSIWDWSEENTVLSGELKIISLTESELKLQLNVRVKDLKRNKAYSYKGERTFQKIN